jgi:hypothetical protein
MANDLDQLPVYDPITKGHSGFLSEIWLGAFSFLIQNLTGYLTQGGILLPQLTTEERDALQSVAQIGGLQGVQNGQMIYNTTLDTAQYFKAGSWVSF